MTWVNIENKELASSVRNKINTLGAGLDTTNSNVNNLKSNNIGLGDVTKTLYSSNNVDGALQKVSNFNLDSYIAFCANVNTTSLDCAFGKNNEDLVTNLGKQLAMYAWFTNGLNGYEYLSALNPYNTLDDCIEHQFELIYFNTSLCNLINLSPYAKGILDSCLVNEPFVVRQLCFILGLSAENYSTINEMIQDTDTMNLIATNARALRLLLSLNLTQSIIISNISYWNAVETTIKSTLDTDTTYFTKTNGNSFPFAGTSGTLLSSVIWLEQVYDGVYINGCNYASLAHGTTLNANRVELVHGSFVSGLSFQTLDIKKFAIGGLYVSVGGSQYLNEYNSYHGNYTKYDIKYQ